MRRGEGACTYLTPHLATPGGHRRRWFSMNRWSERDAIRKSALICDVCGVGVCVGECEVWVWV